VHRNMRTVRYQSPENGLELVDNTFGGRGSEIPVPPYDLQVPYRSLPLAPRHERKKSSVVDMLYGYRSSQGFGLVQIEQVPYATVLKYKVGDYRY